MLYHLHEMQRAALTPLRLAAEANQQLLRNPLNPLSYTPQAKAMAAALEIFEETTRAYGKPDFGLHTIRAGEREILVREEIVAEKPFCALKHFIRETEAGERVGADDPRLLIVAPLSGHFATLLRGTVEAMLPDHEVYITDWFDARTVPLVEGAFDLDDYMDYVVDFLHELGPGTHVMAVCQPSVPVLAAVSLMAEGDDPCQPRSMTLMGGPIDTRRNPTTPCLLATEHSIEWFEQTVVQTVPPTYPGFMRKVYPGFLQLTGFMTMNLDRHVDAHVQLFGHLIRGDGDSAEKHRAFYDEYRSVMDLPAEYYLQTVQLVFQEQALAKGEMRHRGRLVDPGAITKTALFTIEGELDDISGLGQTEAAHDLCANLPAARKAHYVQEGVGHYGIFNGSRWRGAIAPRVRDFIRSFDKPFEKAGSQKSSPMKSSPKKSAPRKKSGPDKGAK